MKQIILLVLIGFLITFSSCRTDFSTVPSTGNLEFSKSKIYLDTIFNNIGSSTYGLKVYNRSNSDIKIPAIQLAKGLSSKYRLMVDGMTGNQGKVFNNVELLAKDSLFIFIEITHDATTVPLEFTYDDQILFDLGANQQKVDLTTLVWDANFIFPNRTLPTNIKEKLDINGQMTKIIGHRLTDNDFNPVGSWTFNNLKPTVIYGYALVPSGKTLTITDGASIYFHADTYSGLIIEDGGQLVINGNKNMYDANGLLNAKHEVTFEGDRLEPEFENTPGQWGGVFIISNNTITAAQTNYINHLTLKNSTFGVYAQNINGISTTPNLEINNSQIYNSSAYGILGKFTNIIGKNVVVNSAGQACFAGVLGGNYTFTHCTFNNDWNSSSQKAVLVNNYFKDSNGDVTINTNTLANFKNCIIFGKYNNIEVSLEKHNSTPTAATFVANFSNCLVKFNDDNASVAIKSNNLYNPFRTPFATHNLINLDPKFQNPAKNKLNILTGSSADNLGVFDSLFSTDILDNNRAFGNADAGAYQLVP